MLAHSTWLQESDLRIYIFRTNMSVIIWFESSYTNSYNKLSNTNTQNITVLEQTSPKLWLIQEIEWRMLQVIPVKQEYGEFQSILDYLKESI